MRKSYGRWVCAVLAGVLALLTLCAAEVYTVDPCFYYRMPTRRESVFFSERYQSAGLIRNVPADTVVLGTSMTANYRASEIGAAFGGTGLRITLPDGYLSEFDQAVGLLFRKQTPKRLLFGLDANILVRDESGLTGAMPAYLYNADPLDDAQYLLNKDTLYYSAYALLADRWGQGESVDEGFTWGEDIWWNHATALAEYDRPEIAETGIPAESYLAHTRENCTVVLEWAQAHPETEFDVFFPPYSMLYWDKQQRQGTTQAVFAALGEASELLTRQENIRLFFPLGDAEIVTNLDEYCDYVHHSAAVGQKVLALLQAGEDQITQENYREVLASWQDFVIHYDYEKFYETAYWQQWNARHAA